jgi:hypothetical protein
MLLRNFGVARALCHFEILGWRLFALPSKSGEIDPKGFSIGELCMGKTVSSRRAAHSAKTFGVLLYNLQTY